MRILNMNEKNNTCNGRKLVLHIWVFSFSNKVVDIDKSLLLTEFIIML